MDRYETPLTNRYSSKEMSKLFSSDTRYQTWRKLWLSLAKAEKACGLDISDEQIKDLSEHITDIDYSVVEQKEKEIRHDVMAHIYAYGEVAKKAKGIIHLGATSCYVTDNADLIIYKEALNYIKNELAVFLKKLASFANEYKALPILGYTHYQPAQLVTVGKRATLWMYEFISDFKEIEFALSNIKFLGCRGATGTEASFVELFNGDTSKIDEMNEIIAKDFGFAECFAVSGQTYSRKVDSRILNALSSLGQSAYKFANDLRLLQHDKFLEEPFEKNQVGSSAMAYKRNPMRSERICSLARFLMVDSLNAPLTASTQWFERTLDDSANRRMSIPEAFLTADSIVRLLINVVDGLVVNKKIIAKEVNKYLPFIATENILMEATKKGGDRQALHEIIRKCSMQAVANMKEGGECDLLNQLSMNKEFNLSKEEMESLLDPNAFIGRSIEQVEHFLKKYEYIYSDIEELEVEITK